MEYTISNLDLLQTELELRRSLKTIKKIKETEPRKTITKEEQSEALQYLLELFDTGEDDTHYLPSGMVKVFDYLDFMVPQSIMHSESDGTDTKYYTIEFKIGEEVDAPQMPE